MGSEFCDPEYLCCELVEEFAADATNVSKVKVRLFHSGLTVETFRSCCSFSDKFLTCSKRKVGHESVVSGVHTAGIVLEAAQLLEPMILSHSFSSASEDEWTEASDRDKRESSGQSGSDWEYYAVGIFEEDLPRLGVVKLDEQFHVDLFEWRMADEFWGSHRVDYSHSTKFKGVHDVPIPSWFAEFLQPGRDADLQPIDIFNKMFPGIGKGSSKGTSGALWLAATVQTLHFYKAWRDQTELFSL
ncbi:hypothetical protein R1sor_004164 [Riccia sorocarpa]|uniref:Uncharacterized protein n=1 Tax=Riccia sorocarpa TaxID=122646 RepID=A0ABD3H6I8_9MARC